MLVTAVLLARPPDKRLTFRHGASDRNRTNDTGIFSPLLYRLSYRGIESAFIPALPRIHLLNRSDSKELSEKVKQDIGVSLAESGFSGELTVNDVKHILKKMYHSFDENYFIKQSENLKLPMNKKIKEFSTGMKAKLRVLTAMTHHAKLLIMDEPTAGLDVEARNEILDMLRAYIAEDESRSILITSHISTDLESLCDELYLIHDGKLILHEATDAILEQYGILKVSEEQYRTLDQSSILKVQKENYGYACFTNDKKFYQENYPQIAVENGGIDELILMMTGGYR